MVPCMGGLKQGRPAVVQDAGSGSVPTSNVRHQLWLGGLCIGCILHWFQQQQSKLCWHLPNSVSTVWRLNSHLCKGVCSRRLRACRGLGGISSPPVPLLAPGRTLLTHSAAQVIFHAGVADPPNLQ